MGSTYNRYPDEVPKQNKRKFRYNNVFISWVMKRYNFIVSVHSNMAKRNLNILIYPVEYRNVIKCLVL